MIKQALILLLVSVVLAVLVNSFSPNNIPIIGQYRELSSGDGPIVPPTASPGDPPFIDINEANFEFSNQSAIFIDARDSEEFNCGTIPGSINIPFDYLPEEGGLGTYFDSCLGGVSTGKSLIVFCSGEECDLSLHLARNLYQVGYDNVAIFFGGAREWENAELEMERRSQCE